MIDSIDKIDWATRPEDATHFGLANLRWKFRWYKHTNHGWVYWCHNPEWGYAFWETAKRPGTKPLLRVADHHPNLKRRIMNKEQAVKQLTALQAEMDKLKAIIDKPVKWSPTGGPWYLAFDGSIENTSYLTVPNESLGFGIYCATQEDAEELSTLVRSLARQFQWLRENDDGWRANWNSTSQSKYYVCYDHKQSSWRCNLCCSQAPLCVIYMSKTNAEKLAAALNSGEVEL